MNILTEIHCAPEINTNGKTIHRTAVRGVAVSGRDLLMIYSSRVGDYKFPGGGVNQGESHAEALCREVQEECGMSVLSLGPEICAVIEYDMPSESDYEVFKMTSYYYHCEVEDGFGEQTLDDYERDLGFKPVWIDIDRAIQRNKALLYTVKKPRWLKREIFVLEYIKQILSL